MSPESLTRSLDLNRIFFFLLLMQPCILTAQTGILISKPRLEMSEEYLVIEYDILNAKVDDRFTIDIIITNSAGYIIPAKSLSGDIGGNISPGKNKRIIWNLLQDKVFVDEELFIEILANLHATGSAIPVTGDQALSKENTFEESDPDQKKPSADPGSTSKVANETYGTGTMQTVKYSQGNLILSSLALPGLGQSKNNTGKPYWLLGIAGYGFATGAVILNRSSIKTYDDYLASSVREDRENHFNKATQQQNLSNILGYTALGIWTVNMIWVIASPVKSHQQAIRINNKKWGFYPVYNRQTGSALLSFSYRF